MPLLLNYSCDTILPFKYDVKFESFSTCGILVRLDDERIKSQTGKHCFTMKLSDQKRQCQLSW